MQVTRRLGVAVCVLLALALFAACANKRYAIAIQQSQPCRVKCPAKGTNIAILDFGCPRNDWKPAASALTSSLREAVTKAGHYRLYSRNPEELSFLVKELEQVRGGGTLSRAALDKLRSESVSVVVFGDVVNWGVEDALLQEDTDACTGFTDSKRQVVHLASKQRRANLQVAYRMLDVDTGQVLAAGNTTNGSESKTLVGKTLGQIDGKLSDLECGLKTAVDSIRPDPNSVPSDGQILGQLAKQSVNEFTPNIQSGTRVIGNVLLAETSGAQNDLGIEYARQCKWKDAAEAFGRQVHSSADIEAWDYYNYGVALAMALPHETAAEQLNQALNLSEEESEERATTAAALTRVTSREPPILPEAEDQVIHLPGGLDVPMSSKPERGGMCALAPPPPPPTQPPPLPPPPACQITAASLNIRETPSTTGRVLGSSSRGDNVTILERDPAGRWFRVQHSSSGLTGWVAAGYVTCPP